MSPILELLINLTRLHLEYNAGYIADEEHVERRGRIIDALRKEGFHVAYSLQMRRWVLYYGE